jgi:hypothetical protein
MTELRSALENESGSLKELFETLSGTDFYIVQVQTVAFESIISYTFNTTPFRKEGRL